MINGRMFVAYFYAEEVDGTTINYSLDGGTTTETWTLEVAPGTEKISNFDLWNLFVDQINATPNEDFDVEANWFFDVVDGKNGNHALRVQLVDAGSHDDAAILINFASGTAKPEWFGFTQTGYNLGSLLGWTTEHVPQRVWGWVKASIYRWNRAYRVSSTTLNKGTKRVKRFIPFKAWSFTISVLRGWNMFIFDLGVPELANGHDGDTSMAFENIWTYADEPVDFVPDVTNPTEDVETIQIQGNDFLANFMSGVTQKSGTPFAGNLEFMATGEFT